VARSMHRGLIALLILAGAWLVAPVPAAQDLALPLKPDSVRFAVIGDFGDDGSAEHDVADLVHSWSPDFVVTVGDNNYEDGLAADIDVNIGKSYSFQAPALEVVLSRLPNTIFLAVLAILLAIVVAIPLGVWMAKRADTKRELGVNVLTIAGQSMPDFWIGIMLLTLFAVVFPIFPSSGFTSWSGVVQPCATRWSPTAWKSSNTFCLCARMPARCHSSPSSPPPRRLATTYTPPASTHASVVAENAGSSEIWNPP